jgi:FkbM family methyltransferase
VENEYKRVLINDVESIVPNSKSVMLNGVSQEHHGWFAFAELETKFFVSRVIGNNFVCIDVGANLGLYSLLFLQESATSRVISFEPSSNFEQLIQNISSVYSGRFDAFQIALGDVDGEIESEIWESYGYNKIKGKFNFNRLDTILEEKKITAVDIIKIDTDGFEVQILNGALRTIKKHHPLVIIESSKDLESGQNFQKIHSYFKDLNYSHLATLDGGNEIFAFLDHAEKKELKKSLSRNFFTKKGFYGYLNSYYTNASSPTVIGELKFFLSYPSKLSHPKFFFANRIPWSYTVISNEISNSSNFIELSGLILGEPVNLLCVCKDNSNLFSIILLPGYYSKVLIPLLNVSKHSGVRLVIRSGLASRRSLILGLKVDLMFQSS